MRVQSDMQSMLNYGYENVDLIKKNMAKDFCHEKNAGGELHCYRKPITSIS